MFRDVVTREVGPDHVAIVDGGTREHGLRLVLGDDEARPCGDRSLEAPAFVSPQICDRAGAMALARLLPYVTLVIAVFTPLAAGIYLLVSAGRWPSGGSSGGQPGGAADRPTR